MGVLLKDDKDEKPGYCPYCMDGILGFDNESGKVFCLKCGYAIKLEPLKYVPKIEIPLNMIQIGALTHSYAEVYGPEDEIKAKSIKDALRKCYCNQK